MHDVIVIGGGPAGLSAALLLGRCNRSVAVFDEGRPRNEMSPVINGFLGIVETSPKELLAVGRSQLAAHPNVRFHSSRVEVAAREGEGFAVRAKGGWGLKSRALIVATGLIDRLPRLEGVKAHYGKSVFPCPYCDGWENKDQPLAAFGSGEDAANLALELGLWSSQVSLLLAGDDQIGGEPNHLLRKRGVAIYPGDNARLVGPPGALEGVELADGSVVPCKALFLVANQCQHHDFLERMGCELCHSDQVECDDFGRTPTPGLFVAGNAKRGLQMAMVAAADGIKCAAAANDWLLEDDLSRADAPSGLE